ncbi:MAG TPA: anti-sigma factor [Micromonosporaceae bacterium]|jgi:hypothetical protein
MSCPFAVNDGAYVLGALAPAERAEFERHLAQCPSCQHSVAQLAVIPGLLGRLDADAVRPAVTAPPELLPRVLSTARVRRTAQRRRQLLTTAAACLVALALAGTVGLGTRLIMRPSTPVASPSEDISYSAMITPSGYLPVEAEIGIRPDAKGTVVDVRCLYHGQSPAQWDLWLVVYPRDQSEAEAIGSWVARPDSEVKITGVTHFTPAQIDRIELQDHDHTTIAWWTPA